MKYIVLAALLAVPCFSATLTPRPTPVIPIAFERNTGQAPQEFSHLMTHYGWGFSCTAVAKRQLGAFEESAQADFVGASAGCTPILEQPLDSYSHYYGGNGDSTARFPFNHRYDRLTYVNVWPGVNVSYSRLGPGDVASSGFWMRLSLDVAERLSTVAFAWDTSGAGTPFDLSKVTAHQDADLDVVVGGDNGMVTYAVPTARAGAPLVVWVHLQQDTFTVTGPLTIDAQGTQFVASGAPAYTRLSPHSALCSVKELRTCTDIVVAAVTAGGSLRSLTYLSGMYDDYANQIRLDPGGNVYVAGSTESPDFINDVHLGPTSATYQSSDIFLVKLHGPTGALIHAITLGGSGSEYPGDMEIDADGRATMIVQTHSPDFPSAGTPLFGTGCDANQYVLCPWLVKIAPYQGTLEYAFKIPGGHYLDPNAGFPILAVEPFTQIAHLVVSGWIDIPIPAGAALRDRTDQALVSIAPDGSRFLAATFLPWSMEVHSLALRPDQSSWLDGSGHVALVDASLSKIQNLPAAVPVYSTLVAAPDGSVYVPVDGYVLSPFNPKRDSFIPTQDAPLSVHCPGSGGLIRLDSSGAIAFATYLPGSVSTYPGPNVFAAASGATLSLGDQGLTQLWDLDASAVGTLPVAACAVVPAPDAALSTIGRRAPGTVIALLGNKVGPSVPVELPLAAGGSLATETGGVRILIGGVAAPILSAEENRVTFVVPFQAPLGDSGLVVEKSGSAVATLPFHVETYNLQILAGSYVPAGAGTYNQDGTLNSQQHPALVDSVVTFHLSGAGPTDVALQDGVLHHTDLAKPTLTSAEVQILGQHADIISFAQAADLVSGIMELRVRIPAGLDVMSTSVEVSVATLFNGAYITQPATLWVAR